MTEQTSITDPCFIGIDVGTGSARAGLFDAHGRMLSAASHPIQIWKTEADFAEQSTEDIWQACVRAVQSAVSDAAVPPDRIRGIGFDATCSLAVVDAHGEPVTVSPTGDDRRNVIVCKLRWLKTHLPGTWQRAAHFFDLADYLTCRATGSHVRSLCTTVCKWTYLGHKAQPDTTSPNGSSAPEGIGGWDDDFWRAIGLDDLVDEGYHRIGRRVRPMGEPVGHGLADDAARDFGLRPGTPVGVSIIDAHAGGLGVLGAGGETLSSSAFNKRLALVGGTSSCHMAVSAESRFIDGVWGMVVDGDTYIDGPVSFTTIRRGVI